MTRDNRLDRHKVWDSRPTAYPACRAVSLCGGGRYATHAPPPPASKAIESLSYWECLSPGSCVEAEVLMDECSTGGQVATPPPAGHGDKTGDEQGTAGENTQQQI
ncbi:unnamed protein product [Pleuronectes platessa]|uniref:Uncharacterized protein n=1 Tax=Pleuronectes platessa TaxID=8262 RepID=A0A9N7VXJ4_PLEPL|nr:unnamed protein product [Pleuronectes platessa]